MIKIKILSQEFIKTETDLAVVTFFKDMIPLKGDAGIIDWLLNGQISNLIKQKKISGAFREKALLPSQNKISSDKILLLGMGKSTNFSTSKISLIYSHLITVILKLNICDFGMDICIKNISDLDYARIVEDIIDGMLKGFSRLLKDSKDFVIKIVENDGGRIDILNNAVKYSVERFMKKGKKLEISMDFG
ncbi:MAG: hypothetical protein HY999_05655 [Nitrospinae bacterium]|nr:hypothetical protein [Nitrospinota bacterium]